MKQKKVTEFLRYTFTAEEKQEIASSLAQANQARTELEERKKQVDADLKAQIELQNAVIAREARRYNNGYEQRDVECSVTFNEPRPGWKTIIRLDTYEIVREAQMTTAEMQQELDLVAQD